MKDKKDYGFLARATWDFHQGSRAFLQALYYTIWSTLFLIIVRFFTPEETMEIQTWVWTVLGNAAGALGLNNAIDKARDAMSPASKVYAEAEVKERLEKGK